MSTSWRLTTRRLSNQCCLDWWRRREGRMGSSASLLFLAIPDALSLAHPTRQSNRSACHQKLPFIESSLVTFCCEHLCMSLASCKNLLSRFSPPQGAIKLPPCRVEYCSLFLRGVQIKIMFSGDILVPPIDWSLGKC